jgi:hypothetical protein
MRTEERKDKLEEAKRCFLKFEMKLLNTLKVSWW